MGRSSTAKNASPRDAASKVARQRLSVLELARELGNVAGACRRRGMDRSSFYELGDGELGSSVNAYEEVEPALAVCTSAMSMGKNPIG